MSRTYILLLGFVEEHFVQMIVGTSASVEQDVLTFSTADVVSCDNRKALQLANMPLTVVGTIPLVWYRNWRIPGKLVACNNQS
ncbi:hypothetical protein COX05_04065 [candidate division WWE3 bacterium CG22_combo_CG10-13_8_21_14_all_39_12]|uniref:Uncharacterized protein n=2 Tax=Katanobacteria TaxID=422282 RepID=A0A2M7X4P2_UNCKA|nr:MAG: hypothetical protein COX05_04065 [candidate division WWE3 bacterium CG22_combo_CG10-13_8_21_14_all_39_12]PJA41144.1 MAG: hypothetical protein CO179_00570 [candidate division WWE3 bacterium CG_4_9_14_3_um_filter_39_7]